MKRRESLKVLGSIPFLSFGGINFVEAKQIERSNKLLLLHLRISF